MEQLERVAVIAGGLSSEREVSLRSGRRAVHALHREGVDAGLYEADAGLVARLVDEGIQAVYVAMHGGTGEDGSIQTALELAGVPYVGSPPAACHLAWDKVTAKLLVDRAGVTTPRWVALSAATFRELAHGPLIDGVARRLGLPLVVKPARSGSTLGMSGVEDPRDLPAALVKCFTYGDVALIEEHVVGTEVGVTVLDRADGRVTLPPVGFSNPTTTPFAFESRYSADLISVQVPAALDAAPYEAAVAAARTAHEVLGLRDISRTDVLVTDDGRAYFLEAAVSPGLTETSVVPLAVQHAGLSLGAVLAELLAGAAARGAR